MAQQSVADLVADLEQLYRGRTSQPKLAAPLTQRVNARTFRFSDKNPDKEIIKQQGISNVQTADTNFGATNRDRDEPVFYHGNSLTERLI